jgi:hypothetical protein
MHHLSSACCSIYKLPFGHKAIDTHTSTLAANVAATLTARLDRYSLTARPTGAEISLVSNDPSARDAACEALRPICGWAGRAACLCFVLFRNPIHVLSRVAREVL